MIGNHQTQIKEDDVASRRTKRRKLWMMVAGVVAVIVLTGSLYAWYQYRQGQASQVDEQAVDQAVQAIIDGDTENLQDTARQIERKPNYREVPEYVYIVARAQIEARQMDEADESIETFRGLEEADDDKYSGMLSSLSHEQMLSQLERNFDNMEVLIRAEDQGVGETMGG